MQEGCLTWQAAFVGRQLGLSTRSVQGDLCVWAAFRRFTAAEARAVLNGMHLLILGDSVSQYWYLSLAYWLHTGDDLKTRDHKARGHAHPLYELWWSRLSSSEYRSANSWAWNTYYNGTSADFSGADICDCWRDRCHPNCSPQSYFGNRYYRLASRSRLSLVMSLGTRMRPRWHDLDEGEWKLRCGVNRMEGANRCAAHAPAVHDLDNTTAMEMLAAVIHHFAPTVVLAHVVTNWPEISVRSTCNFARSFAHRTPASLTPQSTHPRPRVLWNDMDSRRWTVASEAAAIVNGSRTASCGAASLDTDKHSDTRLLALVPPLIARLLLDMPKDDVYIDNVHFQPWVYHEISQLLLNVLTARRVHSA